MTKTSNRPKRVSQLDSLAQKKSRLLEAIQKLERDAKSSSRHRIALAEAEFRLAILVDLDLQEAIQFMQKAIEHDPFHPKYFFHLGRLLFCNGDFRAALHEYRQALKLAPASHRTYVHLALTLLELDEAAKKIGRAILDSLARNAEHELSQFLVELDDLIAIQSTDKKTSQSAGQKKVKEKKENSDQYPKVPCRWSGVWRLSLIEQLLRPKLLAKQIEKHLDVGAQNIKASQNGIAEYATVCLFLLLSGDSPKAIEEKLQGKTLQSQAEHPAVQLLYAVLILAKSENGEQFVAQAKDTFESNTVPPEIIFYLHYMKYGPDSTMSVNETLKLLNAYSPAIRTLESFKELHLAILDGYARRAWAEQRYNHARLLWRETIPLDPYRIAVAHNLALVATRTKSYADYRSAWDRSIELRYLHAAGAGDAQVMVEDRRTLHLAFAQQSKKRYCPSEQTIEEKELTAWLADKDALEVWLREWDLYYLNSRLHFRSPVHVLGIPRDASEEITAEARDVLLRLIVISLRNQPWTGIKTFCHLAEEVVRRAFEQASDLIARARDVYYENEKKEADKLASDAIDRGFKMHSMMTALVENPTAENIPVGCAIARHLFALPWKILQPICVAQGMFKSEVDLLKIFESYFLALITADKSEPKTEEEVITRLAAIDDGINILPHKIELRVIRCKVLLKAKKNSAAYSAALEAFSLISSVQDQEEASKLEENLTILIDNAAFAELPEYLRGLQSAEQAEITLKEGQRILEQFPRAAGFRNFLAKTMLQLGGKNRAEKADELLKEGIELALNEKQKSELQASLQKAGEKSKEADVLDKIRKLLETASQRVSKAIDEINRSQTAEAIKEAQQILVNAIKDTEQAKKLAEKAGLMDAAGQADDLLQQFKEVQKKLRER